MRKFAYQSEHSAAGTCLFLPVANTFSLHGKRGCQSSHCCAVKYACAYAYRHLCVLAMSVVRVLNASARCNVKMDSSGQSKRNYSHHNSGRFRREAVTPFPPRRFWGWFRRYTSTFCFYMQRTASPKTSSRMATVYVRGWGAA